MALLREGGIQSDTEVDIAVVRDDRQGDDGGVRHGARLQAFVDAAMTIDPGATQAVRADLVEAMGEAATVDAAAVTAMFQLNTRVADAAGVAISRRGAELRNRIGHVLGFEGRVEGRAP